MTQSQTATVAALPAHRSSQGPGVYFDAALGALIGLLAFWVLGFGPELPTHRIAWLMVFSDQNPYYDPSSAYVAWNYFRHTPWMFPLGADPHYGMEFATGIFVVDSAPLMAVFFKLFAPLMGLNFQYIGILLLMSFALQGMFASMLAGLFSRSTMVKIVVAAFFVTSPVMMERAGDQYGLTAHWLVLWPLYLYLKDRGPGLRWVWFIVVFIALGFHLYFVPMVLGIWAADALRQAMRTPRAIPLLALEGVGVLGALALAMWVIGFFLLPLKDSVTPNFGMYAANLLGPVDSWGMSLFLLNQPKSPLRLGEGFCYLGLGMLILLAGVIFEMLRAPVSRKEFKRVMPLSIMLTGLAIFSLSNKIALGSHLLVLPNFWIRIGNSFRSSGRMTWAPYYGVWLAVFYIVTRRLQPWRAILVLGLALIIQLGDLSPMYQTLRDRYQTHYEWSQPLRSPFWAQASTKYHHIVVVPSGAPAKIQALGYWGSNHGLETNAAGLARYPGPDYFVPISEARLQSLRQNRPDPDFLYIVPESVRMEEFSGDLSRIHALGTIDGYNVIAPFWYSDQKTAAIPGLQPGRLQTP